MDFLSELLSSFLGGDVIKALAKKTGIKASDLKKFVSQALPYLLENLTKNASSEEGASSLLAALMEHTDSRSVDKQIADADIVDGAKIIGHILGTNESKDLKDLSKQSKAAGRSPGSPGVWAASSGASVPPAGGKQSRNRTTSSTSFRCSPLCFPRSKRGLGRSPYKTYPRQVAFRSCRGYFC